MSKQEKMKIVAEMTTEKLWDTYDNYKGFGKGMIICSPEERAEIIEIVKAEILRRGEV